MRIVHAADIHLDSPLTGLEFPGLDSPPAEFRVASRRAFIRLIDLCISDHADVLLIAGDMYNQDLNDFNSAIFTNAQFARLREVGTHVVIVRGNHDAAARVANELKQDDHVHVLAAENPETVSIQCRDGVVAVHGQSYTRRDVSEDLASEYPARAPGAVNIGLLHTSLQAPSRRHVCGAPTRIDTLCSKNYDYWALGHIHKYRVVRDGAQGAPWIVYSGCLQGQDIGETGPKGSVVFDAWPGHVADLHFEELSTVRWEHIELDARRIPNVEALMGRAREEIYRVRDEAGGRLVAARLRVTGATDCHDELVASPARFSSSVVALGQPLSVYVQRVDVDTRPIHGMEPGSAFEAAIISELENALATPHLAEEYVRDLTACCDRVRAVLADSGADLPQGPDALRTLLPQVQNLLVQLLRGHCEALDA